MASFALMHLVAVSLSTWFSTIINEAIDDYVHIVETENLTLNGEMFTALIKQESYCVDHSIIDKNSMYSLPYLYPFTVEYNICMASVWYMIWTNIGKQF